MLQIIYKNQNFVFLSKRFELVKNIFEVALEMIKNIIFMKYEIKNIDLHNLCCESKKGQAN